jgi:hypothetical protein
VAYWCSNTKAQIDTIASMVSSNALSRWHKTPHCSDLMLHTSEAAREVQQHNSRRVVHGALQTVHEVYSHRKHSQVLSSEDTGSGYVEERLVQCDEMIMHGAVAWAPAAALA